jgi:hypothetical protein
MAPPAACKPICMNQVTRTALLAAMPTLDGVDIATVQRGDLSRGMVIPRTDVSDGLGGAVVSGRGGSPACSRGNGAAGGSGPALTLGKGKEK